MATLQARIEGYIGAITGSTNAIEGAMSSEARILIDALPAFDLIQDGASNTVTTRTQQDQFPVDNVRILDVMVSYPTHASGLNGPFKALQVSRSESGRMLDQNSLYYRPQLITGPSDPIVRDPVYYIEKIQDFPAGDTYSHVRTIPQPSLATNEVSVIIEYIPYPSISLSDANLYEIPKKILQALVYYGTIEEISYRLSNSIDSLAAAFYNVSGLSVPTPPIGNLPSAPLLAFNVVSPTLVAATSISEVTPPTPPQSPIFTYTDAVAGAISGININTITSLANTLSVPNAPVFSVSAVTPTSVSETSIATVPPPSPPPSPYFTYTDAVASTVLGLSINNITSLSNTLSVPSAPSFSYTDVMSSTYTEANAALDEIDTIVQDLSASFIPLPALSTSYTSFNTAMANGDIELAQSYLSKIQTEISEYKAEVEAAIGEFSALNSRRYDSSINHAINKVDAYLKRLQDIASREDSVSLQNEAKELERQISEYRLSLDRYTQDLSKYQSDVQKLVQATQIELEQLRTNAQLQTDVNVQNEARTLEAQISEYQSALSLYQAELNEYQTEVQKSISQAQLAQERLIETAQRTDNLGIQNEARELERQVSEYRSDLDRYTQDLAKYQSDVQKLVQATQIELEQLRTNAQLQTDVSVQNEARALEEQISEYQSSLNLYQAELNEHQIEVQKAITQAQLTQERLVEAAQRTDNLGIQNEARRLEKEVSEYRLSLERFGTEIQTYGQDIQSYGLQLQSKVSEANDKMQRKTLEIQSLTADRQYYGGLYAQELQKLGVVQANG